MPEPLNPAVAAPLDPRHVLLTGFPGFLSTALLGRLLEVHPVASFSLLILPSMCAVADRVLRELKRDRPGLIARVELLEGDITRPRLGLAPQRYEALAARLEVVWHLAALYDLAVAERVAYEVNLEGTRQVLNLCAAAPGLRRLNYLSTCYVSGDRTGRVLERELVAQQRHKNHYEASKFWAEVEVQRRASELPVTIFRPSIVVGHSRTGRVAKYDGPYYIFRLLDRLPKWAPLLNLGSGEAYVNLVPVDYITSALAYLGAHAGFEGQVFQLADPNPMRASDVLEMACAAFDRPGAVGALAPALARLALSPRALASRVGLPPEVLAYFNHPAEYDTAHTARALAPTSIRPPHLSTYLSVLIDFYRRNPELDG